MMTFALHFIKALESLRPGKLLYRCGKAEAALRSDCCKGGMPLPHRKRLFLMRLNRSPTHNSNYTLPFFRGGRRPVPFLDARRAPKGRGGSVTYILKSLMPKQFQCDVAKSRDSSKISSTRYSSLMQCMSETPSRINS